MSQWREFEIKDFEGIQDGRTPSPNSFKELINFDLRGTQGDLVSREGFSLKYSAPSFSSFPMNKISNVTYLGFENIYVNSSDVEQEITILVAKGTISAQVVGGTVSSLNSILIFASHKWNGSAWVQGWDWLNEIVITKLTAQNATYPYQIKTDIVSASSITSNYFNTWTAKLINGSKYKIVDTFNYGTDYVGLKISSSDSLEGVIELTDQPCYLMKNYIDTTILSGNYSATSKDISFHKILDGVRIGFGGYENRFAFSVKYQKNYLQLKEYLFGSDTDYTSNVSRRTTATIDGLIVTTYVPPRDNSTYKIILAKNSVGAFLADKKYYVRMTGVLDGFNEVLLSENSIITASAGGIKVLPYLKFGAEHKRLTSIRLWISESSKGDFPDSPFYLLNEVILRDSDFGDYTGLWTVDTDGYLKRLVGTEKWNNNEITCASKGSADGVVSTTWNKDGNILTDQTAPKNLVLSVDGANDALKFTLSASADGYATISLTGIISSTYQTRISFDAWASVEGYTLAVTRSSKDGEVGLIDVGSVELPIVDNLVTVTLEVSPTGEGSTHLTFRILNVNGSGTLGHYFEITNLSIKIMQDEIYKEMPVEKELTSELGYSPTFNMVKSWDSAKVTQGKTFVVNPYIDKRYVNKIFFSSYSGSGAFMYDVIPASQYLDLEKFDGNQLVDIEVLPNMDFLAISRNSAQRVDPLTNQTRDITIGVGCVARRSIISFGDRIMYAGEFGIIETDGNNYRIITNAKIQNDYEALTDTEKSNIIAGISEKDKSYLFYNGATTAQKWYLLTQKGWIKFEPYVPSATSLNYDKEGNIWYLDSGTIYKTVKNTYGDWDSTNTPRGLKIKAVTQDFDIDLMGSQITGKYRIYIGAIRLYYRTDANINKLRIFLNGNETEFKSFNLSNADYEVTKSEFKLPLGAICDRFNIVIDSNNLFNAYNGRTEIYSIAILWKAIPVGKYG